MASIVKWMLVAVAGLFGLVMVLAFLGNPLVWIAAVIVGAGLLIERLNRKHSPND